jgi:hypothetical protein
VKLGLWDDEHPTERFTFCEFATPDGLRINQTIRGDSGEMYGVPLNHTISVRSGGDFTRGALDSCWTSLWLYGGSLLNVTILQGSVERDGSTPVNATQCTLYWYVNTYQSSMANGRFMETTLAFWNVPPTVRWDYVVYNGKLSNNYSLTPAPVRANLTPSTFFVGERASAALRDKLWGSLGFSSSWAIRERSQNVSETLGFGPDVSNSEYFTDLDEVCHGRAHPNDLVNLFLERDPRDILDGLAKTLTTYIR